MLAFLINTFVLFLVVLDPVGLGPVFIALTPRYSDDQRRRTACRAVILGGAILLAFAVGGNWLLRALGIGLPALRVAGGALLFLLAIDMVFARQSGLRSATDSEQREAIGKEDITVFPLAFPLIAGPGAITTVMLISFERRGEPAMLAAALGLLIVALALALLSLLAAPRAMRLLGQTGANVIGRLLGLLLAALAAQFVIDGLRAAFA